MYALVWSPSFIRTAEKFLRNHPDLRGKFAEKLRDLEQDPHQPRLHLHRLHGKLSEYHAISLTHDYRITLTLKITEKEIILLDVGGHDSVYR